MSIDGSCVQKAILRNLFSPSRLVNFSFKNGCSSHIRTEVFAKEKQGRNTSLSTNGPPYFKDLHKMGMIEIRAREPQGVATPGRKSESWA